MFMMLGLISALTRVTLLHSLPCKGISQHSRDLPVEHDNENDYYYDEVFDPKMIKKRTNARETVPDIPKVNEIAETNADVLDREDHVTQYTSDILVNTDYEITGIEVLETDEDRTYRPENSVDRFFKFLTDQELMEGNSIQKEDK